MVGENDIKAQTINTPVLCCTCRVTTVTTDMGATPTVTGHDLHTLSWAIFTAKVQIR